MAVYIDSANTQLKARRDGFRFRRRPRLSELSPSGSPSEAAELTCPQPLDLWPMTHRSGFESHPLYRVVGMTTHSSSKAIFHRHFPTEANGDVRTHSGLG